MPNIKVFNKATLKEANDVAEKRDYNRQIKSEFIDSLPDNKLFPVVFTMLHEHAQGKRVNAHVRCWVSFGKERVFIDCDMDIFNKLPSVVWLGEDVLNEEAV